jgi:hypothetical protein
MRKTLLNSKTLALALTAASLALGACNTTPAGAKETGDKTAAPAASDPNAAPDNVVVYYFHGARRCRTCVGIQETIQKTVRERFVQETGSGAMTFKEINIDEPANQHFAKEFNLSFSTMVVTANKGQKTVKWENFYKVWDHARDPEALTAYTEKSIRSYLALLKKT